MYFLSMKPNLHWQNVPISTLCILDQSQMMNIKYSPTDEISFCFPGKITLCVNEGLDSNSSSEEEVEYSVGCFLTGRCLHPKMQKRKWSVKQNLLFFNFHTLHLPWALISST